MPHEDVQPSPTTVAVIDIGSNSIRMAIAQFLPDGDLEVLERTQRLVGLGHDTFLAGRLGQHTMNAAIAILRDYRKLLDTYQAQTIRAVATSAVREAANGDAFVDRVAMAVGMDLDVLDPAEESRLTLSAVRDVVSGAVDIRTGHALIADVGGGNTLLTLLEDGVIVASESYALGAVRLHERLATTREPLERAVGLLRQQIANVVADVQRSLPMQLVQSFVLVGQDARFAAEQAGQPAATGDVHAVDAAAFEAVVEQCSRSTPEELARKHGLPLASAQRLTPALLIHSALRKATGVEHLVVCDAAMLDGLLLDIAREARGEEDTEFAESVVRSAKTLGEKFRYDRAHADHVAHLCMRLFDELADEHALGPRHRLLLRVGAVLHEVGRFVSSRAHHKHSFYLVANSEVFGLSRAELRLAALVARYHRRARPRDSHLDYIKLPREDRIAVRKLASLLRVADALDRGHSQQARDIRFERGPDELVICVDGAVDLTLERRAMTEKADLFEDTFGLRVRLAEGAPSPGTPQ